MALCRSRTMNRKTVWVILVATVMLVACEPTQSAGNEAGAAASAAPDTNVTAAPVMPTGTAIDAGSSATGAPQANFTPPGLTPEAERGVKGARNTLLSFARAIEERKFDQAWTLLSPTDQRRWSKIQFAAMFADLGNIIVVIPTGTIEGAAGSAYYSAPLTVSGSDKAGRPVRMEGKAVLRRVNDVDGSTPAQRRWHFETLALDWTH